MKLHFREYGEGQPIIILHGLFGSSDNWLTQAKLFAPHYKVYTIDQRNHGLSPHSDDFDYRFMADDLLEFVQDHQLKDPIVIGHSMGGKTAMNFAIAHPDKLSKLIVVDIAPRAYNLEHYTIAEGLKAIDLTALSSRNDADVALSKYVEEADVRQFLLKNLQRKTEGGFSWKINLKVITAKLSNVGVDLHYKGVFEGPTLFIRGQRSNYVKDTDWKHITEVFPSATLETMEAGHWVQAEKPQEFVEVVSKWLSK
ncbi:MAG TPA: alpha/beta fold hydrolase [Chryseolinea sp.]|nr:alpha/beta fold hydrolase [Chryseolinea sp.]HPH47435.1 alpha/beta fold hydrolase [Chryseolinea sp.]HPM32006.1 alpha/beta fold hydrolase [Chryseolinea sp.]